MHTLDQVSSDRHRNCLRYAHHGEHDIRERDAHAVVERVQVRCDVDHNVAPKVEAAEELGKDEPAAYEVNSEAPNEREYSFSEL